MFLQDSVKDLLVYMLFLASLKQGVSSVFVVIISTSPNL